MAHQQLRGKLCFRFWRFLRPVLAGKSELRSRWGPGQRTQLCTGAPLWQLSGVAAPSGTPHGGSRFWPGLLESPLFLGKIEGGRGCLTNFHWPSASCQVSACKAGQS